MMTDIEINEVKHLLEKTKTIKEKIDNKLIESGENYNIFNALRIRKKEVLHSRFIKDLLNPKGSHKQGDVFLDLFLKMLQNKFTDENGYRQNRYLNKLKEYNCTDFNFFKDEQTLGKISKEFETGGSIDIFIKGPKQCIIIENKIDALDQKKQLIRYSNSDKGALLLYLTKYGKLPNTISTNSKNSLLKNNIDYYCISYEKDILYWLEQCLDSHLLRDKENIIIVLKQYIRIIKQITNQNSDKMNEEYTELLYDNIDKIVHIKNLNNTLKSDYFYKPLIEKLVRISKDENGNIDDINSLKKYNTSKKGILIEFDKNSNSKFYFTFKFNCSNGYTDLVFSIRTKELFKNNDLNKLLTEKYLRNNPNATKNNTGKHSFLFTEKFIVNFKDEKGVNQITNYSNWENGNTIKKILNGEFEKDFKKKIEYLRNFIINFEKEN